MLMASWAPSDVALAGHERHFAAPGMQVRVRLDPKKNFGFCLTVAFRLYLVISV